MLVTQTVAPPVVMAQGLAVSPLDPSKWRPIVATTVLVEGSIRSMSPSSALATHRASDPAAIENGLTPTGIVADTYHAGSALKVRRIASHSGSCAAIVLVPAEKTHVYIVGPLTKRYPIDEISPRPLGSVPRQRTRTVSPTGSAIRSEVGVPIKPGKSATASTFCFSPRSRISAIGVAPRSSVVQLMLGVSASTLPTS